MQIDTGQISGWLERSTVKDLRIKAGESVYTYSIKTSLCNTFFFKKKFNLSLNTTPGQVKLPHAVYRGKS